MDITETEKPQFSLLTLIMQLASTGSLKEYATLEVTQLSPFEVLDESLFFYYERSRKIQ